jgi:hypothetical protein
MIIAGTFLEHYCDYTKTIIYKKMNRKNRMLRGTNEIITRSNYSHSNHSSPLAYLDLAVAQRPSCSKEKQIALLIHSLRENYLTYGRMIAAKHRERSLRSQSDYYYHRGFFALPRVSIPAMKPDSPYIHWQRMVNKTIIRRCKPC